MSIDHPHGGGEPTAEHRLVDQLICVSQEMWTHSVSKYASMVGDERLGVVFSLYRPDGTKVTNWEVGELLAAHVRTFTERADTKCIAMHRAGVMCSGIVVDRICQPPIFDGGIQLSNAYYLACSGLRAELDRTFCIILAQDCDVLSDKHYNTILYKAPNEALCRSLNHEVVMSWMVHQLHQATVQKSE